ncbi:MAG: NADPH-dependent FMN reductase [Gemmatimonadaceae bacterium]
MPDDGRPSLRVLVFEASYREASLNARLATLAASVVEQKGATVDRAHMTDFDCPSYDQDVETGEGFPPGADRFRERLVAADALIVASPEYNASMPGALKNLIDWTSRFRPQPFKAKQTLVMSASPSMTGGKVGLWALRVPLEHLGARVYPDMFALAQAHQAFDAQGRIADAKLQTWFESNIGCFLDLAEAVTHYPALKAQWVEFLGERPEGETEREESEPAHAGA